MCFFEMLHLGMLPHIMLGGLDLYFENGLVLGLSFCELCTLSDWRNGNLKKNTVGKKTSCFSSDVRFLRTGLFIRGW